MDWDSPTTKKHIAEAEAQGCELLGPGKNCHYRTYLLPCGHHQEIITHCMKSGQFRCRDCLSAQFTNEAAAQNCKILGPGRNKNYRNYQLPCGHQQEIQLYDMRRGCFRCVTCTAENLEKEALAQGCKLLGEGRNSVYRAYLLPCGHTVEIQTTNMRRGNFRCQTCLDERLYQEAKDQRCELLGPGKNRQYRTYRLPCGHQQQIQSGDIRRGNFRCAVCMEEELKADAAKNHCEFLGKGKRKDYGLYRFPCGHQSERLMWAMRQGRVKCQICFESKLISEAELQGCELIGTARNSAKRKYRLPCGHEMNIGTAKMRVGNFRCDVCQKNKHVKEAERWGCKLLGKGSKASWRTYELDCGHEQEIQTSAMRNGVFRCQSCDAYSFTQPSNLYLLHVKAGSDEWLKLGYAKNVDFRHTQYGLPISAEVKVLTARSIATGLEAMHLEKALHKKYRSKRLRPRDMKEFHTSGGTECYPVKMVETLLAEFRAQE